MAAETSYIGHIFDSAVAIGRDAWDRCAGGDHPFTRYDFFRALEVSGCIGAEQGWHPHYIGLSTNPAPKPDDVIAVLPLFVKGHSYGEFVFDHSWAHAFERAGGAYYPKLLGAVPFTPVTGPRLLVAPNEDAHSARKALALVAADIAEKAGLSSVHFNFLHEQDITALRATGYMVRNDQQFHWQNDDYADFEAFLGALSSRKRKQIRKERRTVAENGLDIIGLQGADITEAHWDAFYTFYTDTGARKWGQPYLNRAFFSEIGAHMGDELLLVLALRDGTPVAGALNFVSSDSLYGRYWGCTEDYPFLHFELCYYQAIDYAIEHGLKTVEAGAQGQHKLARGYVPTKTYSAHWIINPGFREAISTYLDQERAQVDAEIAYLDTHTPFKQQAD